MVGELAASTPGCGWCEAPPWLAPYDVAPLAARPLPDFPNDLPIPPAIWFFEFRVVAEHLYFCGKGERAWCPIL